MKNCLEIFAMTHSATTNLKLRVQEMFLKIKFLFKKFITIYSMYLIMFISKLVQVALTQMFVRRQSLVEFVITGFS